MKKLYGEPRAHAAIDLAVSLLWEPSVADAMWVPWYSFPHDVDGSPPLLYGRGAVEVSVLWIDKDGLALVEQWPDPGEKHGSAWIEFTELLTAET